MALLLRLCHPRASRWLCFQALAQNSELRERLRKIHAESLVVEPNHINLTAAKVGAGMQRRPSDPSQPNPAHHVFILGHRLLNCIPTDIPFLTTEPTGHVVSFERSHASFICTGLPSDLCTMLVVCDASRPRSRGAAPFKLPATVIIFFFPSSSARIIRFAGHRERADLLNHVPGNLSNTQCEAKRSSSRGGLSPGLIRRLQQQKETDTGHRGAFKGWCVAL